MESEFYLTFERNAFECEPIKPYLKRILPFNKNDKIMKSKMYLFVLCSLLVSGCGKDPIDSDEGTFKDSRDKHVYKYVKIGTQTWMAENLAYLPSVSPSSAGSESSEFFYVLNYEGSSVVDAKDNENFASYGVLYNWEAAKMACPSGWHLPSDAEWTILEDYLTGNGFGYGESEGYIGKSMASTSGWNTNSLEGTIGNDQGSNNRSGFTALPGGGRYINHGFGDPGSSASFWSSSEYGLFGAWYRFLTYFGGGFGRNYFGRGVGFSVRCLYNQ
jgi:uncharacterized protein (TIGR02145 family)